MVGFFVAIAILMGTLFMFSIAYKKRTGRNFFIDLYNDMRGS